MVTVANGSAVNWVLTTWHGPADIGATTAEQIRSQVVDLGSYDVPCNLVRNSGFSSNAVVDDTLLWGEMKKRLHKAAYDGIYKDCLKRLCPYYGNNLATTLKDLLQDTIDTNGINSCMTVHAYDTYFWNVTCPLHATDVDDYGQDLCPAYLAGLNPQVKKYVKQNYPNFHCQVDTACDV
jgi:hypothetical protein